MFVFLPIFILHPLNNIPFYHSLVFMVPSNSISRSRPQYTFISIILSYLYYPRNRGQLQWLQCSIVRSWIVHVDKDFLFYYWVDCRNAWSELNCVDDAVIAHQKQTAANVVSYDVWSPSNWPNLAKSQHCILVAVDGWCTHGWDFEDTSMLKHACWRCASFHPNGDSLP